MRRRLTAPFLFYKIDYQSKEETAKMITARQEIILNALIKEYINTSEPVSSELLCKKTKLDISPATVRNDLQNLTEAGFITQPHTSAGRVPTKKAYKYFSENFGFENFIERQIKFAHEEIEREIKIAEEIMASLEQDNLFEILNILDQWHKRSR